MTPASPHIYTQEGAGRTGFGYTLSEITSSHYHFSSCHKKTLVYLKLLGNPRDLTTNFLWAAAGVIGQADDHLACSAAHGHRHAGAVVLHRDDGVIVAAVHAAGII